jgi:hypothetical protein
VLSGEAAYTNFIVFGLTRPGLEPMINRTQDEHTNHYGTNAVNDKYIDITECFSDILKKTS